MKYITNIVIASLPVVSILFALDTAAYVGVAFFDQQYLSLCLGPLLLAIFLTTPLTKAAKREVSPLDILLCLLAVIVSGYVLLSYPQISYSLGQIKPIRVVLGGIALLLVLEACRRSMGILLVLIALVFLVYARYAYLFPGIFNSPGVPWPRLLSFLYLDPNALFGVALDVAFRVVAPFVLMGTLLVRVGGGKFFTDLAYRLVGRFRGGPALSAVCASAIFGSLSGSAVSNVVTTGVVTIPMMKRVGYSPDFAGAVEAAASSGGTVMPPIMGAAGFLMAEFLSIPYAQVAWAAAFPATLYFLVLGFGIRLRTEIRAIPAIDTKELAPFSGIFRSGWYFSIPVAVLLLSLFALNLTPGRAGIYSTLSLLPMVFYKERKNSLKFLAQAFIQTGNALLELGIVCCIAGLIIGSLSITGLAFSISSIVIKMCGGSLMMLILMTAGASIIMGMGMPVTASYVLLVILIVPALVQYGVNPLAGHMFILFYAMMSFLTPPVCLAVYAACSISGGNMFKTALHAVRLSIVAYLIPIVFIFDQTLLLVGSMGNVLFHTLTFTVGMLMLQCGLMGHLFVGLGVLLRLAMFLGCALLIVPMTLPYYKIAGLLVLLTTLVGIYQKHRKLSLWSRVGPSINQ